jgi:hypothetical protein
MKIILKIEARLLFQSEPVIFRKKELKNVMLYSIKHLKDYQYNYLFSFLKFDLKEEMIYSKDINENVEDFYLTDYNSSVLFISNLKTSLTKKHFNYIKSNLQINFYSPNVNN